MALSSHNHEHVIEGANKTFLNCLLFYGIQLNTYVFVFQKTVVLFCYCLETGMGNDIDYVM